jgi:hypothetical protein
MYLFYFPISHTYFVYIRILGDRKNDGGSLESIRDYIQIWGERVLVFMATDVLYAKISFSKDCPGFFIGLKQQMANSFSNYIFDIKLIPLTKLGKSISELFNKQIFNLPIEFLSLFSYEYDFSAPSIKKMKNLLGVH